MSFNFQPTLTGDLVVLRPMTAEDWPALFSVASDPQVWALHPAHNRYQEAVFRPYFEEALASGGALVAIDRKTGAVVGSSSFRTEYVAPGEIEIGWTYLARAWWGGAHNQDMKRLMLDHALASFDQVIFRIGEDNLRSRRAVEKIGARLTGRSEHVTLSAGPALYVFYVMTAADFATSPLNWPTT